MNREKTGSQGINGPHSPALGTSGAPAPMPSPWRAPCHPASHLDASRPPNSSTAASEIYKRSCIVPGYSDKVEAEMTP
eukprot:CAMPEP_0172168110 /NCGR_PEP_ID=MMETSP1050-20130122/9951_1 /TAXON_ID=233186 /ORGANISM="Cryptomonas curvata, Strain CCAP979/52" /LENGTH=77 /DNA_ID=CAMNT_0012838987 /DNA_START=408 /DNA_END=637 /DNA_ORIENTATION=-